MSSIKLLCIQDVNTEARDIYATKVTTKYRSTDLSFDFAVHRENSVRCPICGTSVSIVEYPKLPLLKALRMVEKNSFPPHVFSILIITAIIDIIMINDLVPLRLFFNSLGNVGFFIFFVLLITPLVSFGIGTRALYLALKNAATIKDLSIVIRKGLVAVAGPAVSQYFRKHQISSNGDVYTGGIDFELKERLSYY